MSSDAPNRTITQEEELALLYTELAALRQRNDELLARATAAEAGLSRLRGFVSRTLRSFEAHTNYAKAISRDAKVEGPGGRRLRTVLQNWSVDKQKWTMRKTEKFLAGDWD